MGCGLSAGELGEKILAALDQAAQMREGCLETAGEYRWEEIVRKVEEHYEGALDHRAPSSSGR